MLVEKRVELDGKGDSKTSHLPGKKKKKVPVFMDREVSTKTFILLLNDKSIVRKTLKKPKRNNKRAPLHAYSNPNLVKIPFMVLLANFCLQANETE